MDNSKAILSSKVIQIVGLSKSGKTTLINELITECTKQGISVCVIKSAKNHKFYYSNKDSDLFLKHGAEMSVVAFKDAIQLTIPKVLELKDLIEITQNIGKTDLIIIEGFKKMPYPKVLIWSEEVKKDIDKFNLEGLCCILNDTKTKLPPLEKNYIEFNSKKEVIQHIISSVE